MSAYNPTYLAIFKSSRKRGTWSFWAGQKDWETEFRMNPTTENSVGNLGGEKSTSLREYWKHEVHIGRSYIYWRVDNLEEVRAYWPLGKKQIYLLE